MTKEKSQKSKASNNEKIQKTTSDKKEKEKDKKLKQTTPMKQVESKALQLTGGKKQ